MFGEGDDSTQDYGMEVQLPFSDAESNSRPQSSLGAKDRHINYWGFMHVSGPNPLSVRLGHLRERQGVREWNW